MPFRDPIDKRSSARLFRDGDHSARAQANAGSEPRDPFWWSAVLATRAAFAARPGAKLISVPLHGGSLSVSVCGGWRASTSLPDDVAVQLDLYLPYCVSHPGGLAIAHIGQSLDGRIATKNGESRWITGEADLLHSHRMRALADAVLVGARTVRADDPQLTVRRCAGDNPFRVVIDPELSLTGRHAIFRDRAAPTLIVTAKEKVLWTKPDELTYDPKGNPSTQLYFQNNVTPVAFADGSVRTIQNVLSAESWRAIITRNGGEVVNIP